MVKENKMGTLFYLHNITYNMLYYFPMEPIRRVRGIKKGMDEHEETNWRIEKFTG